MASKSLQTFEHAIKDADDLLVHFDKLNTQPPPLENEVIKRAGIVMALAALETYFEELLRERASDLCGPNAKEDRLSAFFLNSLENDLKTFHTPNADRVRQIFSRYFGYDVTEGWIWNQTDQDSARERLNQLAKLRGEIAHRAGRPMPGQPNRVKRADLRKHIHFIKAIAKATDAYVEKRSALGSDVRKS